MKIIIQTVEFKDGETGVQSTYILPPETDSNTLARALAEIQMLQTQLTLAYMRQAEKDVEFSAKGGEYE